MLLALGVLLSLVYSAKPATCASKGQKAATPAAAATAGAPAAQYYFWNEITGEVQWEDPGDVPFEDESGVRYWLSSTGEKLSEDPNSHAYNWVEYYSEDLQRTYYYNQVTKEATWNKPIDLAWRRVPLKK